MPDHKEDIPGRLFNRQEQTAFRRALRKNQTTPEQRLWRLLRNQQLGVKFRRQQGIGPYTVDFYCAECQLVIEIDGESHFTEAGIAHDLKRDRFLREKDLMVLHFNNRQIMTELDAVVQMVAAAITKSSAPDV